MAGRKRGWEGWSGGTYGGWFLAPLPFPSFSLLNEKGKCQKVSSKFQLNYLKDVRFPRNQIFKLILPIKIHSRGG